MQPVISSVVKRIRGRRVRSVGRVYSDKIFSSAYPLSNIEITNYFNYKSRFNGVFSRNDLPRIKHGAYVINLDDTKGKETHWVSLFIGRNTVVYFYSFEIEYIRKEVLNKIKDQSITYKIFRIKDNDCFMT